MGQCRVRVPARAASQMLQARAGRPCRKGADIDRTQSAAQRPLLWRHECGLQQMGHNAALFSLCSMWCERHITLRSRQDRTCRWEDEGGREQQSGAGGEGARTAGAQLAPHNCTCAYATVQVKGQWC